MFFNTFDSFFPAGPHLAGIFFIPLFFERSGSSIAVRYIVGVAPPLPFDLNPARQHGKRCIITFLTRVIVGFLLPSCACACVKVRQVMAFIGCSWRC